VRDGTGRGGGEKPQCNATGRFDRSAGALTLPRDHSAFNTANAIGPWAGGLAIANGLGWTSTGYVGCGA
jgi:predicted MFS family arabinose efflux permease